MELLLTLVVAAHWMACVWFFTGYPHGWVSREFDKTPEMLEGPHFLWVQWISSFYFAITTMSTIGYGDITADSSLERVVAVCCMVTGCVFFAMLTGMESPCTLALRACAYCPQTPGHATRPSICAHQQLLQSETQQITHCAPRKVSRCVLHPISPGLGEPHFKARIQQIWTLKALKKFRFRYHHEGTGFESCQPGEI
jgi:hypothetical protein